jgi:hypothetical protein
MFLCAELPRDDAPSGDTFLSDTTLHDEKSATARRDSLTTWVDERDKIITPVLFPFQLIAGCSTAERVMCQYSRTITSHEVYTRSGSQGTLTWRWRSG